MPQLATTVSTPESSRRTTAAPRGVEEPAGRREQPRGVVARGEQAVGEHGQRVGLGPRRAGLGRTPGRVVDDRRDGDPDGDEDRDGEDVLRLGDRQRVERRREEVVEQQGARQGRHDGRREAADEGRRHHDDHQRHRLDRQAVEVGGGVEGEAQQCRRHQAEDEPGQPARPAEVVDRRSPRRAPGVVVGDDVDVDVARAADDPLADSRPQEGGDAAPAAGADDDLGGVLGAGEGQDRVGGVVADDGVEGAAELVGLGRQPGELVGRGPGEPVLARDVQRLPLTTRPPRRDPGGPAHQGGRLGSATDGYDDALARRPRGVDLVLVAVAVEALVDAVGEPQERQLAERREVALAEVARQGGVDLVGGVDVAVGHPAAQRLRAHVDQLDLVGGPHHVVRHRLALPDPGHLLGDVVERLEVLDVDGGDDLDARVEEGLDVLPALLVGASRHVGVGELVDEHHVGPPLEDGLEVHLLLDGAAVADLRAGHDLEPLERALGLGAAVGLDVADHQVGAPLGAAATLVEHGVGLAHARCRAEVDPQPSAVGGDRHALSLHQQWPPRG